ncbi:MAG: hypothetical protein ACI87E_003441 [Mariniblastus sp.]
MNQEALQARVAHAEALKAQMRRVQQEQAADQGFARKAYEAQQAYQTELAFQEYLAYQNQSPNRSTTAARPPQQYATVQTQYRPAPQTNQQPVYRQASAQPGSPSVRQTAHQATQPQSQRTYHPPVHAAPSGLQPSAQTKAAGRVNQTPNRTAEAAIGSGVVLPQRRVNTPATTLPVQQTSYQAPQDTRKQYTQIQPASAQREFILQEESPPVGLQDRIASLLSQPRYAKTNPQPTSTLRDAANSTLNSGQRKPRYAPQNHSARQQAAEPQLANQPTAKRAFATRSTLRPGPQSTLQLNQPADKQPLRTARLTNDRRDRDVQHAFEMQQQHSSHPDARRSIQQVAMLTPAQDPFNDRSMTLPANSPSLRAPRSVTQPPRKYSQPQRQPARQISVLSNRQDEGQGGLFQPRTPAVEPTQGGQFNPSPGVANDLPGGQTPQDFSKIDDELNERLRQLEQENNLSTPLDDRAKQLKNDIRQGMELLPEPETNQDITGGGFDRAQFDSQKPVEKSCEHFRSELLQGSITEIALDISPGASKNRNRYTTSTREWSDRSGNLIATGKMTDLRRGYVIIEGINGTQRLPFAKLSDADWAAVSEYWRLPTLCSVGDDGGAYRNWVPQTYTWKASSLCHKPLFFENVQLERYGHSHGPFMQPIRSVGHFFVSMVTVPYQSAITPANECQYALGFYRPGNCAPWLKDPIPFSLDGARRQALITTGLVFIP